jgi:hypothetical protein
MGRKFGVNVPPHARRAVAWYSPQVLLESARQLVSSIDFQRNADRRDLFPTTLNVIDLSGESQGDGTFGFDFVSDTGDSGNATYTVAAGVFKRELEATGRDGETVVLPEGRLLVLGGDLAYPGASVHEYQYRFSELFEAARDPTSPYASGKPPHKVITAIAQNHDWFDCLSTFSRHFLRKYQVLGHFLDENTRQQQSYFAIKLPHNWWVLGFDFALSHDLDGQQLDAFKNQIAPKLSENDKLILVYPEPYWVRPLGDGAYPGYPKRYQRLEHTFEQAGAQIRIRIAGDLHHYVRQSVPAAQDGAHGTPQRDQLITCGVGGAFTHPTHANKVVAARTIDRIADADAMGRYRQGRVRVGRVAAAEGASRNEACFPSQPQSRALARGNLLAFFRRGKVDAQSFAARLVQTLNSNFGFAVLLGALYWFNSYVNALPFSASFRPDGFKPMCELAFAQAWPLWLHAMVFSPFGLLINILMVVGCAVIAREEKLFGILGGIAHGLAHGFMVLAGYWLISHWVGNLLHGNGLSLAHCSTGAQSTWHAVLTGGLMLLWGTVVGGLLFGVYLWIMAAWGLMPNNAYGSLAVEDYKGFMRFHIGADGKLTARFLGVEKVPRDWVRHADPHHRPLWTAASLEEQAQWKVIDQFELD